MDVEDDANERSRDNSDRRDDPAANANRGWCNHPVESRRVTMEIPYINPNDNKNYVQIHYTCSSCGGTGIDFEVRDV